MSLRRLMQWGTQYGITGPVVNVPVDINKIAMSLPRNVDEDYSVNVHLKRRLLNKPSSVSGTFKKSEWLTQLFCGQGYPTSRVLSWEVCSERSTAMDGVSGDEFHYRCHVLLRGSPDRGTFANRGKLFVQAYYMSTEKLKGDFLYVDQVRLHTDYNATNHRNNIALLTVQRPLVFSRYTKPICIPTNPMNLTDMRISVSGWGRLG
ncbi:hypothetical protein HPB49_014509 [Dermacentor silvarum]|uniref:Uncharacterized protein n=1 Tax=Dermacentor silvarum TaxID=543639 RepID=A0ACB8C4A0_DERSI|nr:hypothetical protein HPB49_014509 [Dermacentor silvarum]